MINIHLYPSPFLNESRILREAFSILSFKIFDAIDLVGTGEVGLEAEVSIRDTIRIRRIGVRRPGVGLLGKILQAARWSICVYRLYRSAPVGCVNCHSVATLPLGCALKWSTGARLVYDAHELETETTGLRGVRKAGTKLIERVLVKQADYSVFVASSIDDWYRKTYGLKNTAVVYNAPALTDIEASDVYRQLYDIPAEVPIFLYQGVISEARGIPKIVEAFRALDRVALVVMGYGDLADWVERESRGQPNIYFHEAVPPQALMAFTTGADFGLSVIEPTSLSYEFCMPNKLFEYLMAGKPVLVSPTREQRKLVEEYGVGVVLEDTSVKSVRNGVLRLLSEDLDDLKSRIDRVRRDYCWERQEQTLRGIYVTHLGLAPRQRAPQ